mmetsp:Transcript_32068/g.73776  ORF Transcript_32068/g.73776 Transcript_32068/m.73776 type:complete len:413 (-) Transcript_32068:174-1412(-)
MMVAKRRHTTKMPPHTEMALYFFFHACVFSAPAIQAFLPAPAPPTAVRPLSFRPLQRFRPSSLLFSAFPGAPPSQYSIDGTPLPLLRPGTFAASVHEVLLARFDEPSIRRVLQSWHAADAGHVRKAYVGDVAGSSIPAADSNCIQYCTSYVPGLRIREWWWDAEGRDVRPPWAAALEAAFPAIREEFLAVTSDPTFGRRGSNVWAGALTKDASDYGVGWKTLVLMDRGQWEPTNSRLFPRIARAVHASGIPCTEAFFASMEPRSEIKMHSDFTNFVLTAHLPLVVPEEGTGKCRLTVGDETRPWHAGNAMMFDTSLMHDAVNETDETRYILMFRLWHPDLTGEERGALQFIYDCLEHPELVSNDLRERDRAQEQVATLRNLPEDLLKPFSSGGFGASRTSNKRKPKKRKKKK